MEDPSFNSNPPPFEWDEEQEGAPPPKKLKPTKKRFNTRTVKAKGRRHQQQAAEIIKQFFPHLEGNDVRSLPMGSQGDDLILSPKAEQVLPYAFEMKNVEKLSLPSAVRQVNKRREERLQPCIVVTKNRTEKVSIIPFAHFLEIFTMDETVPISNMASIVDIRGINSAYPQILKDTVEYALKKYIPHRSVQDVIGIPSTIMVGDAQHITVIDSKRFFFWKKWEEMRQHKSTAYKQAMIFNWDDCESCIYIALSFQYHLTLLREYHASKK